MTDLSPTIAAKSDQLNSDDLLGGPKTIKIARVTSGTADQPINIFYEGDGGKPWKPCKSMRRVLVSVWGPQGAEYVGRWLTLFRDPSVKWGGIEVGGVRISHMSDIENDTVLMLTETRGKKSPYKVMKLNPPATVRKKPPIATVLKTIGDAADAAKIEDAHKRAMGYEWSDDDKAKINKAKTSALHALTKAEEEPPMREMGDDDE